MKNPAWLLLIVLFTSDSGAEVLFTWTLPDTREDGSQLLLDEISHVTLFVSSNNLNTATDFDIHADTYSGVYPPGNYQAWMTCTDTLGNVSQKSVVVAFVIPVSESVPPLSMPAQPNLEVHCDGYKCYLDVAQ